MIQFLSLFSGVGAPEKALDRLGVKYNLVNYCEIDKYASKSYAVVHGVPESLNLGDITKVDTAKLPHIDMVFYGFPCQDISLAGKQKGLFNEDGTQTRSGLFFEALRIIEDTKPKVAIAENVKNLTSKKFSEQFQIVLDSLEAAGYNNYWQVLNAKDFGVPQNRERVFIVSIRKDIDNGCFKFPEGFPLELRLKDLLESEVDEKYYISKSFDFIETPEEKEQCVCLGNIYGEKFGTGYAGNVWDKNGLSPTLVTCTGGGRQPHIVVKENNKRGYTEATEGDSVNFEQPNSKTRRGRVGRQVAQTLTTSPAQGVVTKWDKNKNVSLDTYINEALETNTELPCAVDEQNVTIRKDNTVGALSTNGSSAKRNNRVLQEDLRIRKLTPLECWRLMGFDDEDYYKAEKVNSNTQLYKQAGNSIVVDVLEYLFKEILEVLDVKKVDDKVIVYECDDLINLEALKEKEPELYAELLADYPAENATYVFKNFLQ